MEHPEHLIKHREIRFCSFHPDPRQAHSAILVLSGVDGIVDVELDNERSIRVSYHIHRIHLQLLEEMLIELGYHLDNSLMSKLKRALHYYTEEVERTNLGCEKGHSNCTRQVFVKNYSRRPHGCRDDRPDHWRRYL